MQKLLLISILIATIAIPARLEYRSPGKAEFRSVLSRFALFTAVYVASLLFVYPHLF